MTLSEARAHIGDRVVYRPPHIKRTEPGEEGVIVSVSDRGSSRSAGTVL